MARHVEGAACSLSTGTSWATCTGPGADSAAGSGSTADLGETGLESEEFPAQARAESSSSGVLDVATSVWTEAAAAPDAAAGAAAGVAATTGVDATDATRRAGAAAAAGRGAAAAHAVTAAVAAAAVAAAVATMAAAAGSATRTHSMRICARAADPRPRWPLVASATFRTTTLMVDPGLRRPPQRCKCARCSTKEARPRSSSKCPRAEVLTTRALTCRRGWTSSRRMRATSSFVLRSCGHGERERGGGGGGGGSGGCEWPASEAMPRDATQLSGLGRDSLSWAALEGLRPSAAGLPGTTCDCWRGAVRRRSPGRGAGGERQHQRVLTRRVRVVIPGMLRRRGPAHRLLGPPLLARHHLHEVA